MPLDLAKLIPQIDAAALYLAVKAAKMGEIPWTSELAKAANILWLKDNAPGLLHHYPGIAEDATCADSNCDGICIITSVETIVKHKDNHISHVCKKCHRVWLLKIDDVYEPRKQDAK